MTKPKRRKQIYGLNLEKKLAEVNIMIEEDMWKDLHDIAAQETQICGKHIPATELVRLAIAFTFSDGERLRECFRRSRSSMIKRYNHPYKT